MSSTSSATGAKAYTVTIETRYNLREFIGKHHYKGALVGCTSRFCFALRDGDVLIGAAVFGYPTSQNGWKSHGSHPKAVLELKRLVCIDDTAKNAESYFLGACLRWLKQNSDCETVITYADPAEGHKGIVYKAANFEALGEANPTRDMVIDGVVYSRREMYRKTAGKYRDGALDLQKRFAEALERGGVQYVSSRKLLFRYVLRSAPVAPKVKRVRVEARHRFITPFKGIFSESAPQINCGII